MYKPMWKITNGRFKEPVDRGPVEELERSNPRKPRCSLDLCGFCLTVRGAHSILTRRGLEDVWMLGTRMLVPEIII